MNSGSFASNEETLLFCGGTAVEDQSIQPNCQFIDLDSDLQDPNSVQDGLAFQNTGASIAYLAEENAMMIIGGMDADGVYNADFVITDTTTFEEAERVPLGGDIPGSVNGCVVKIDDDKYFYTRLLLLSAKLRECNSIAIAVSMWHKMIWTLIRSTWSLTDRAIRKSLQSEDLYLMTNSCTRRDKDRFAVT